MRLTMLYFAWVREAIGVGEEIVDASVSLVSVGDLIDWLSETSERHRAAFADRGRLRAAVDQNFVGLDASIATAREIAIFPPVTGG